MTRFSQDQPEVLWRITLLGDLRAVWGDRVVRHFRTRKTGLLLAYLAYYLDRPHLRETLIDLFWPGVTLEAGRASLSTALASLRRALEPPGVPPGAVLRTSRTTVELNADAVTTDVAAFEAVLKKATGPGDTRVRRLTEAAAIYGGELLPGYVEDWVLQERAWLAERYFEALQQLLRSLEAAGDLECAVEYARQGVRADPLREEAQQELVRLLAASGRGEGALRQYRDLERLLARHLDATPAPETRALAAGIRQSRKEH